MTYDQSDFFNRLMRLFPKRWAGTAAFAPPSGVNTQDAGVLYSLLWAISGELAFLMSTWAYVALQTRLATMTDDTQAALASQDFFDGRLPRNVGESIGSFTTRIRQQIVAPTGFLSAVQSTVAAFLVANPLPSVTNILVFDLNSDPARSAYYGIVAGQFAIAFYAPVQVNRAWYLGSSQLDYSTYLVDPNAFSISTTCPFTGLGQQVSNEKDLCYQPLYIIAHDDSVLFG